jgi:ATP-binding cassette, subfamily C, bacterial CydC
LRNDPLLRLIRLVRPSAPRFLAGVLLGALAAGSGIALLGIAAWLLARAAEHPPITALSVAVVATRALGVTRGVARYLERLVTHDAALRALADVRSRVYERLARTEPIRRFRSSDLVSRLVNDVDSTQDLLVRGLTPPLVAGLAGGAAAAGGGGGFLKKGAGRPRAGVVGGGVR